MHSFFMRTTKTLIRLCGYMQSDLSLRWAPMSQGTFSHVATHFIDIRGVCKKISPYIVHQWRDVCEELGVPDETLDRIETEAEETGERKSELAFQGLALWFEKVGRAANKDKLMRVVQLLGLRRAEGNGPACILLHSISDRYRSDRFLSGR